MQLGLLKYTPNSETNIFNIGDYIQSLSVRQFIEQKDFILIDRERLDEYKGEGIKLVLNGWFMHNPKHWPPSSQITPLFVAFHLNSSVDKFLLSSESLNYFKKYEPIGCRDFRTKNILEEKGVQAYFSGCMTLTLGAKKKYGQGKRVNKVYFSDPFFRVVKSPSFYLYNSFKIFSSAKLINKLSVALYKKSDLKSFIKACSFYLSYSNLFSDDLLEKAEFIKQEIPADAFHTEEEKFAYAENLLNMYADAQLVVTSRIHCALPCLALETPVVYVEKSDSNLMDTCRLEGLRELFNIAVFKKNKLFSDFKFNEPKITLKTKIINKTLYLKYRSDLIEKCTSFFEK